MTRASHCYARARTMSEAQAIRALAAERDARVEQARAKLAAATSEREREEALCQELQAKLAFERGVDERESGPPPVIAARVALGDVAFEELLAFVSAMDVSQRATLERELVAALSAEQWIALEAAVPSAAVYRTERARRAAALGDREGAILLALTQRPWALPDTISAIAEFLPRGALEPLRERAIAELAAVDADRRDNDYAWLFAAAPLALALDDRSLAVRAAELDRRMNAVRDEQIDTDFGDNDVRVRVLRALIAAGERGAGRALLARVFDDPTPQFEAPTARRNCVEALAIALFGSTPEERISLEQAALARYGASAWASVLDLASIGLFSDERREAIIAAGREEFEQDPEAMPAQFALAFAPPERCWRAVFARIEREHPHSTLADRFESDRDFRDNLISWAESPSAYEPPQYPGSACEPLRVAASAGCRAAGEALVALSAKTDGSSWPRFFVGLAPEQTRAIIAGRRSFAAQSPIEMIDARINLLRAAAEPAREAFWPALRAIIGDDWQCLRRHATLAPNSAVQWIAARLIELCGAWATTEGALQITDARVREAVARRLYAPYRDDRSRPLATNAAWSIALALTEVEEAREVVLRAWGSLERAPIDALPPALALEWMRSIDPSLDQRWMGRFARDFAIDRVAALDDGPPQLARFAAAAARAAVASGPLADSPSTRELPWLLPYASLDTLAALGGADWSAAPVLLAQRALIRCAYFQMRDTERAAILAPLTAKLYERLAPEDLWGWPRFALRAFASPERASFAEAIEERREYAFFTDRNDEIEIAALGMADALLALVERWPARDALDVAQTVWVSATDAGRARAMPWIVAAVRERRDGDLPEALVRDLPVELLIERWSGYAGSSVFSICQSPAVIERIGGQSAVDRMAIAIIESAARTAGR